MTLLSGVFAWFLHHRREKMAERKRLEKSNDAPLVRLAFEDSLLGWDFPLGEPVDIRQVRPLPNSTGTQNGNGGMGVWGGYELVYDDDYWWLRPCMCPELRSIDLGFLRDEVPPEWLPELLMKPSVKEITLSGDDALSVALAARFCISLETLRVELSATSESFRPFGERRGVRHLFLEHSHVDDRLLMEIVERFPNLETLEIDSSDDCDISPHGITDLGALTKLRRLRLDGCTLGSEHVNGLARLRSLRDLSLEECDLNDAAIEPLKSLPKLRMLNVEWEASDEHFKRIEGDWRPRGQGCRQLIPVVG